MSIDDKPTPNELRICELESAIKWVLRDAAYKAPEQIDAAMAQRWMARLQSAFDGEVNEN
jgi:hypothetical protein